MIRSDIDVIVFYYTFTGALNDHCFAVVFVMPDENNEDVLFLLCKIYCGNLARIS